MVFENICAERCARELGEETGKYQRAIQEYAGKTKLTHLLVKYSFLCLFL